jgi:hypothetical protein
MKTLTTLLFSISLTTIFLACKKNNLESQSSAQVIAKTPTAVDVYAAGIEIVNNRSVAKYWKNEVGVNLTNAVNNATATAIAVVGNDVYVTGYEEVDHNIPDAGTKPKYWKNGVPYLLDNDLYAGRARGICIDGTDIYICGNTDVFLPIPDVAKYWKNGTAVILPNGINKSSYATSISVSGADVYVSGYERDENTNKFNAVYWKNGVRIALSSNSASEQYAWSIFASGTDVYVCGYENIGTYTNPHPVAKYWKNGTEVYLTNNVNTSDAYSIKVIGADVYVGGGETNAGVYSCKYWKNGVPTNFVNSPQRSSCVSLFIFGNEVYGCGGLFGTGQQYIAQAYLPSNVVSLTTGTTTSYAYSIFVTN